MTYDEMVDMWERERLADGMVEPYTVRRSACNARRFSPTIGGMPADGVKPLDATRAVRELRERGSARGAALSPASIRKSMKAGKQVYKWAIRYNVITCANPFDAVEIPREKPNKKREALDEETAASMLREIRKELDAYTALGEMRFASLCLMVVIGMLTGMRRGELLALTWGDIDFDNSKLTISKAYKADKYIGEPKSEAGKRTISLGGIAIAALSKHRAFQRDVFEGDDDSDEFVFCNDDGEMMSPDSFERWWGSWAAKHGIGGVVFHQLRHTHATMLIAAGVDVKTVQTRLGHSDAEITLNVYAHAVPKNDELAAAAIDDMILGQR